MDKLPLLTVIVPVYKVEKYLYKCLDSIINQTYRNLSIICVNDGSPDSCAEILSEYSKKDSRITVITTDNRGLSAARNVALNYVFSSKQFRSSGIPEYITFVDSDDWLELNAYETALSHFKDGIDLVSFSTKCVPEEMPAKAKLSIKLTNDIGLSGEHLISDDVIDSMFPAVWCKIFRSKLIVDNNIYFPDGLKYEDNYFTVLYLIFCHKVWFDSGALYNYLLRNDSIMGQLRTRQNDSAVDFIDIAERILTYLKNNLLFDKHQTVFWNIFYRLLISAISNCNNKSTEDCIYKKALAIIDTVDSETTSVLHNHYLTLLRNSNLKPYKTYRWFYLLKIKHRPNYDKYSFLGIPILKNEYCKSFIKSTILGFIIYNKKG